MVVSLEQQLDVPDGQDGQVPPRSVAHTVQMHEHTPPPPQTMFDSVWTVQLVPGLLPPTQTQAVT
jgi:hypothetical protein